MDNVYLKNYGIWLGGILAFGWILGFAHIYIPPFLSITIGLIVGTVQTHKELGHNIQYGKAIGPVLAIIGAFSVLTLLYTIIMWGGLEFAWILEILIEAVTGYMAYAAFMLLMVGMWYTFEKAGKPGWAMFVPIYNYIIMLEIAKKPSNWIWLFFIPIANIVFIIMTLNGISKNFGKDEGFTVGLVFLSPIFYGILGFGDAQYIDGPNTKPLHQRNDDLLDDMAVE